MEVLYSRCCGIDVHKASISAVLRKVSGKGKVETELREMSTTYDSLLELLDWLMAEKCEVVAMESTGVYWKPVYHILNGHVEVIVGNAREVKRRTNKKTDKTDAGWIAELLAHGLITPSFIPPPEISALRDLTRMRTSLVKRRKASPFS